MNPATGFHSNVSFADYRVWDAVHVSQLKLMSRSPMHCLYALKHPRPQSSAMLMGAALHHATFEPAIFNERYLTIPPMPFSTNADKEAYRELMRGHSKGFMDDADFDGFNFFNAKGRSAHIAALSDRGKSILSADERAAVEGMAEAIAGSRAAGYFIKAPGQCEVSALWRDEGTGLDCCGRFDRLAGDFIVELKSTKDARQWGFEKDIADYGYHLQAAWYLWGARRVTGRNLTHVIIAVENEPPYGVAVYSMTDAALQSSHVKCRRFLDEFARCKKENRWPGYEDKVQEITLPKWELND